MDRRVPMAARRLSATLLAVATTCGMAGAQAVSPSTQTPPQTSASSDQNQSQGQPSSSSQPHHKSAHHVQVAEETGPPPELTQAEALIQKKSYAASEPLLQKVVASDPANYEAWFDLGFAENGMGKVDESIAAYRKSVEAKPDVFESNLNLGLQLAKTHQPDAEQFLVAATKLKPTSHMDEGHARAWLSLGHLIEATKVDEALAAFRQAAALEPKDPDPRLSAGILLEKSGKTSEAIDEYKAALALDPSPDAVTALANIYLHGRRFPEAEEYLRKLVALSPRDAVAHVELGRVLVAENKNDDAVAELQTGAKLAPTDLSVQRDLADLYVTMGKTADAEAAYRVLSAANPNDAELHRSLGQCLLREKKFPEAQQELLITVKLKPNWGEAYGDVAFAASENKNYPLALQALDARVKFLPEIPITYFLRASAFDHLKDFKKAAVNYHLFLDNAQGKYPDQEWQAKHRLIAIQPKK